MLGVELREDEGVADATPQSPQRSDHLDAVRAQRGVRLGCDVLEPLGKVVEEVPDLLLEEVRRQAEVGLHDVEELGDIGTQVVDRQRLGTRGQRGEQVVRRGERLGRVGDPAELGGERLEAGDGRRRQRGEPLPGVVEPCLRVRQNAFCLRYAGGLELLEDVAAADHVAEDPDGKLRNVGEPDVFGRRRLGALEPLRLNEDGADAHMPIPTAPVTPPSAAEAAPATAPSAGSGAAVSMCLYASLTLSSDVFNSSLRLASLSTSVSSVGLRSNAERSGGIVASNAAGGRR